MTSSPVETEKEGSRESTLFLPVRQLGLFSICLPAIALYACTISTYVTHKDEISKLNYSSDSPHCPYYESILAPVSFSMATWEPQRQIWILAFIIHLPVKLFLIMMIPQTWRQVVWRVAFYAATTLELLSIVCISLFHAKSGVEYYIHTTSFCMLWLATIGVISIVVHEQRVTGLIHKDLTKYYFWLAKIGILTAFVLISVAASISFAKSYCSQIASILFCIGEYFMIGLNAAFWALLFYEFSRDFYGFQVVSLKRTPASHGYKVSPENTTDKFAPNTSLNAMASSGDTEKDINRGSSLLLPVRALGIFAICLPTITVYACTSSAYLTHSNAIAKNNISNNCPDYNSILTPVSYSIATFKPQMQLWMLALFLHFPAKLILVIMIPRSWPKFIWRVCFYVATSLEELSIVCISLFHIESIAEYVIHAVSFSLWWCATIGAISIVVYVQGVDGCIHKEPFKYNSWLAKIFILIAFVLFTTIASVSYLINKYHCSLIPSTLFPLGEYFMIALNAAFWALLFIEFSRDIDGFHVTSVKKERKNHCHKIAPENPTDKHV